MPQLILCLFFFADRTAVITKWQHEEHQEFATQFVQDIVEKIVASDDSVGHKDDVQPEVSVSTAESVAQVETASQEDVADSDAASLEKSVAVAEGVTLQSSLTVEEYRY